MVSPRDVAPMTQVRFLSYATEDDMRATLLDVIKHPTWIDDWWLELPMRQCHWWKIALFAKGEGWLRWAHEDIETQEWESNACTWCPEWHRVWPPIRRMAIQFRWLLTAPLLMKREHLSWEEVGPDWSQLRADPERRLELWR